jgi:hypothetical protein
MRKIKYVKLFEDFLKRNHRYKLLANTQSDIIKGLKWFRSNFDITNGFVNAVASNITGFEDGDLLKYEVVEDHAPQFIKKSEKGGYEIEIGLFNYDGKILPMDDKWHLNFIHNYMKKDNIKCEIIEINETLQESEAYGTSGEEPPSWTVGGTTIKIEDVQKYLDENDIPVIEIPVKDIFNKCAHRNKTDKKTLDRSERSDLKFPIIVLKKNGKYHMVLDGHHRLLKVKNNNIDKIKARVFNLEDAPDEYKKVLY